MIRRMVRRRAQYRYGRRGEIKIANRLRKKGYSVKVSEGSRGAADIIAHKGGRKYAIQAKRTRKTQSPRVSPDNLRRLKISARRQNATPVIAKMIRGKVSYESARINRKIRP